MNTGNERGRISVRYGSETFQLPKQQVFYENRLMTLYATLLTQNLNQKV